MADSRMKHGGFGWVELMTTEVEEAKKFYTSLFGWEAEEAPMEGMKYTIVKVADEAVGGMMAMPPEVAGMPPSWSLYVTVDDVDATAGQAERLGGKILRAPADVPGVGRFCVLRDPQGAAICAITYEKK